MADKTIGELTRAAQLDDDSLLVMEQQGEALALEGAKLREFAEQAAADVKSGATFTPALTASSGGVLLSFTNDAGLPNPTPLNVKGEPGAGTNPNLLDNWYFADPINQRGKTTYDALGYTIDRWRMNNVKATMEVANGLKFTTTSAQYPTYFVQFFDVPLDAGAYTLSVLADAVSGTVYFQPIYEDGSFGSGMTVKQGLTSKTYNATKRISRVLLQLNVGSSATIRAVKMELGSAQTLAHQDTSGSWVLNDPPPDKGLELLKCQRYYQLFSSADKIPGSLADYRPVMRAAPATGTIVISGVTYHYADANL